MTAEHDHMAYRVVCGACGNSWCEACDPAPSALCHWCHGRGVSTAPLAACGHPYTPPEPGKGGASGYARLGIPRVVNGRQLQKDQTVCYSCSDSLEAADMAVSDDFFAYLSGDGQNITTWPGGVLARVTGASRPYIRYTPSGGRYEVVYVTARDSYGAMWHGRGPGRGMYVRLKRSKVG